MEFEYSSDGLTPAESKAVDVWLRKHLPEVMGESDDVFLEYINVMIANRKNMQEISSELVDFMGQTKANDFTTMLGQQMKRITARSSKSSRSESATESDSSKIPSAVPPTISSTHSSSADTAAIYKPTVPSKRENSLLMGPLKSSRDSSDKKESADVEGVVSKKHKGNVMDRLSNQAYTSRTVSRNSNNNLGGGSTGNAAYSEMVQLAQASGFRSPAEMLVMQQQQLMTLMQGMQTVAAMQVAAPFPRGGYPGGRGGRFAGRGFGRGDASYAQSIPNPQLASMDFGELTSSRGFRPQQASLHEEEVVVDASAHSYQGGRGRGGFASWRGSRAPIVVRGGRGRGRIPWRGSSVAGRLSLNKSWVRTESAEQPPAKNATAKNGESNQS